MDEVEAHPTNFTRQIIDEDLANGKCTTVHTRFPPEPSSYLHTDRMKSTCLNLGVAQDCKGQCDLRFDDTNPIKEDIEYVDSIKNDVEQLGFHWPGNVRYSPDYFDQPHAYATELINKGLACVDELTPEQIRGYRDALTQLGKNSPYCDCSVEGNLALFEKVHTGGFEENKAHLRTKTDMTSPFIVVRDPVLHHTRFTEHHQTDSKRYIYPMCDPTHCISDALEGITRSLYTLKFQGSRHLYDWALNNITIPIHPRQCELSRLNLEYIVISKRGLNLLMTDKHVEDWGGPYMPTISGLRRRGYTAASIREFYKHIDVTKQDNTIEMALLESCVREGLNENALRAITVIDPMKLVTENYQGEDEVVTMPSHPDKPEMGSCQVPFSDEIWIDRAGFREEANRQYKRLILGEEVRPRNAYVIKVERVEKDAEGGITTIFCTHDIDTLSKDPADGRKVKDVIHWVNVTHALSVEIRLYDRPFSVLNLGVAGDFLSMTNPESLAIKQSFVRPSPKDATVGKAFRSECEGYFCLDGRHSTAGKPMFNRTVELCNT